MQPSESNCCHVYLGDITLLSIPLLSNAADNNKVGFGSLALVFHSRTNYRLGSPPHWCCRFWPQAHWSNHKRREFSVDRSFNSCSFFLFFSRKDNPRSAPITNSGAFNQARIFFVLIWPELTLNSTHTVNVLSMESSTAGTWICLTVRR